VTVFEPARELVRNKARAKQWIWPRYIGTSEGVLDGEHDMNLVDIGKQETFSGT
jgi:hypothetical protein